MYFARHHATNKMDHAIRLLRFDLAKSMCFTSYNLMRYVTMRVPRVINECCYLEIPGNIQLYFKALRYVKTFYCHL